MNSIYFYVNNQDVIGLSEYIRKCSAFIYNEKFCIIDVIPTISNTFPTLYIGYNQSCYIEYSPCFYTSEYLQPAKVSIINNKDSNVKKLYSYVKKYIKDFFILSTDKSTYIGPCIYQDWLERKYKFPMLLEYLEFEVDENKLYYVIDYLHNNGYIVRNNKVRIRDKNQLDFLSESFVILEHESLMKTKIINKSIVLYEYDSECIWIYRRSKTKKIVFQLDKRLILNGSNTLQCLYEQIKNILE